MTDSDSQEERKMLGTCYSVNSVHFVLFHSVLMEKNNNLFMSYVFMFKPINFCILVFLRASFLKSLKGQSKYSSPSRVIRSARQLAPPPPRPPEPRLTVFLPQSGSHRHSNPNLFLFSSVLLPPRNTTPEATVEKWSPPLAQHRACLGPGEEAQEASA